MNKGASGLKYISRKKMRSLDFGVRGQSKQMGVFLDLKQIVRLFLEWANKNFNTPTAF